MCNMYDLKHELDKVARIEYEQDGRKCEAFLDPRNSLTKDQVKDDDELRHPVKRRLAT